MFSLSYGPPAYAAGTFFVPLEHKPWDRACAGGGGPGPCWGFPLRRWNGRERWLAQPGPHFLGRNGGKNPRGKRFFPLDSLLWWGCVGEGCTSCGIPGLRPSLCHAGNGPPTGWAGWGRGQVPFGKRQRGTVRFPTFSSRQQTTSPARPSRWAGHEALVLEATGQAHTDPITFPCSSHQRMGFQGEGTSFPLVFFPLFLQRNRAPPGRAPFPPVPTAMEKAPTALCPQPREKTGERAAAPSPVSGSL